VLVTQEQKSEEGAERSSGCGDFGKGLWGWRRDWSDLVAWECLLQLVFSRQQQPPMLWR